MKPPEPMIAFSDCALMSTATARDGCVIIDGRVFEPSDLREVCKLLLFLADAAERQREHETSMPTISWQERQSE